GNRRLDRFGAGIPNLRLAAPLSFAAHAVVRAKPDQLCSSSNALAAKLRSEVRKINIARMLISLIDADVAARFAAAIVVSDRFVTAWRTKAATGREASVLHAVAERRIHHKRLERRSRNVVFVQRSIQERPFLAILVHANPRCFVVSLFQAVRR